MMSNSDPEGQVFLSHPHKNNRYIFLLIVKYSIFMYKKGSHWLLNTLRCDMISDHFNITMSHFHV